MNIKFVCSALAALAVITVFSCVSGGASGGKIGTSATGAAVTGSLYTGDGGKGISLAILAPRATGLAENQNYLPALVQGEFVSNFSGYSAIAVLDRVRLEEQYAELLSGYYNDDAGSDLGHLTPTDYILGGSITKTAAGYALQISITKTSDKTTTASYSGTCTAAELDNLTGVRRASLDLLQKMGVAVTARAQTELSGAETADRVNAQTALAQGITAQQSGSTVAALAYYSQAADLQSGIAEADQRLAALSQRIKSGDIGDNIRNDIDRRDAWSALLDEAVYYVKPEVGDTDYANRTAQVKFDLWFEPNAGYTAMLKIVRALDATGMTARWGLDSRVRDLLSIGFGLYNGSYGQMYIEAELLDGQGDYVAAGLGGLTAILPLSAASGAMVLENYRLWNIQNSISFTADAARLSDTMRMSGFRTVTNRQELQAYSMGRNYYLPAAPFTGTVPVIASKKPLHEYFRGRRGVQAGAGVNDSVKFTLR